VNTSRIFECKVFLGLLGNLMLQDYCLLWRNAIQPPRWVPMFREYSFTFSYFQ